MDNSQIKFPMAIRFNEKPTTEFYSSANTINVEMIDYPQGAFRTRCFDMIMSTWQDDFQIANTPRTQENIAKTFRQLLAGKVLPNSMEHLQFMFKIEGITLVEITHILRHRMFHSIHAQCTADRFLTHDSAFIPSAILDSEFRAEYEDLTIKCKELYQKMVDSKKVSIMDARYILNRNNRYFYYVGMNLKDAIAFIRQRRCTAIQPELDNILAAHIYGHICSVIPELRDYLTLECDPGCHTTFGNDEHTTRLYQPDVNHRAIMEKKGVKTQDNPANFIYQDTREDMGNWYDKEVIKDKY